MVICCNYVPATKFHNNKMPQKLNVIKPVAPLASTNFISSLNTPVNLLVGLPVGLLPGSSNLCRFLPQHISPKHVSTIWYVHTKITFCDAVPGCTLCCNFGELMEKIKIWIKPKTFWGDVCTWFPPLHGVGFSAWRMGFIGIIGQTYHWF